MTRMLFVGLVVLLAAQCASGATVFITHRADDPTATDSIFVLPGTEFRLHVWFRPDDGEVINGASIDIATNSRGALDAIESTVLNPIAGPFGPRYNGEPNHGNVNPTDPNLLVEGMLGVSVNATGIDAAINDFGDFDPTFIGGALRFAEIRILRTQFWPVTVFPAPNAVNPITAEGLGAIDVTFQGLRLVAPPEPTSAILAALGMTGLGLTRRRS